MPLPVSTTSVTPSARARSTAGAIIGAIVSHAPCATFHFSAPLCPHRICSFFCVMMRTSGLPTTWAISITRFSASMCFWCSASPGRFALVVPAKMCRERQETGFPRSRKSASISAISCALWSPTSVSPTNCSSAYSSPNSSMTFTAWARSRLMPSQITPSFISPPPGAAQPQRSLQ